MARAIIKNPKILVFDEATSALDKKNEAEVQKAIHDLKSRIGAVTTITIAHRLSTIKDADRILVLKKGEIVEDGNHDQLLRQYPNGTYANLVSQQENIDQQAARKVSRASFHADRKESLTPNATNLKEGGELEEALKDIQGEVDAEAEAGEKEKMKEAEALDAKKDQQLKEALAELNDPKTQGGVYRKKIAEYNKPLFFSIAGVICSSIMGLANPVFGAIMIKCIFGMLTLPADKYSTATEVMNEWVIWLAILCAIMFVAATVRGVFFGYVGETITLNMRSDVYNSVMRKHMGWHDIRTNNSGVITSIMAGECSQLQGLSTDAIGVILECIASLGFAIAIGFYFSWPMALIALCLTPFMALGALLQT